MKDDRLKKLEARVAQLEREVSQLKEERIQIKEPPVEKVESPLETKKDFVSSPSHTKEKEPTDWETLIGKVWLPRIFIFVLLLGLVWAFRIAVDAGWLNETNRIIIGFITAGLFYFVGNNQLKNKRVALGKVLLVGFIATLLVTTFAMNVLYGMIPSNLAFLFNILWIGFGIYLSHVHRSQVMGVMFAVAGYLIPFLVAGSGTSTTLTMVIIYELLYYLSLLWFAAMNQFRILFYVSTIFLHVIYIALAIFSYPVFDSFHTFLMTLGILIQHETIVFTLLKGKIEKLKAFPIVFSSFAITLLWAKIGFEAYELAYLFTIYVCLTTIRYGWLAYDANRKQSSNLLSIATVSATFGISVLLLDVIESEWMLIALYLIQGSLAVYVGYQFRSKLQKYVGYVLYFVVTLLIITNPYLTELRDLFVWAVLIGTLYFHIIYNEKEKDKSFFEVNISLFLIVHFLFLVGLNDDIIMFGPVYWLIIIGSLFVLYKLANEYMNQTLKRIYLAVNVLIHLMFISYLAREVIVLSTNAEVLLTTVGWAVYALGCVYVGMKRQWKLLRMVGVGLIFFTLLKLIFFDLAFISLTTRAILFVFIGLVGIVVSRFIYGKSKE